MMGNLNAGGYRINNVTRPEANRDAVNKEYADGSFIKLDGTGIMANNLNMGEQRIVNVGNPTDSKDAVNKKVP